MQFKCVTKWWYAFINDPSFVDKHLSNSYSLQINQFTRALLKQMLVPTKESEDPKAKGNGNEIQSIFSMLNFDNNNDVVGDSDNTNYGDL